MMVSEQVAEEISEGAEHVIRSWRNRWRGLRIQGRRRLKRRIARRASTSRKELAMQTTSLRWFSAREERQREDPRTCRSRQTSADRINRCHCDARGRGTEAELWLSH